MTKQKYGASSAMAKSKWIINGSGFGVEVKNEGRTRKREGRREIKERRCWCPSSSEPEVTREGREMGDGGFGGEDEGEVSDFNLTVIFS